MLTTKPPLSGLELPQIIAKITTLQVEPPPDCTSIAYGFLKQCLRWVLFQIVDNSHKYILENICLKKCLLRVEDSSLNLHVLSFVLFPKPRRRLGNFGLFICVVHFFSARGVRPSAAKLLKEDPFVNFTQEEQSRLAWLFTWCSGLKKHSNQWIPIVDNLHEGDTEIKPAKRSTEASVQRHCNRYSNCFGVCADVVAITRITIASYADVLMARHARLRDQPKWHLCWRLE